MTIQITKAQQEDAKALMEVSKAAFNADINFEHRELVVHLDTRR